MIGGISIQPRGREVDCTGSGCVLGEVIGGDCKFPGDTCADEIYSFCFFSLGQLQYFVKLSPVPE